MNDSLFQTTLVIILGCIGITLGIESYTTIQINKALKPPSINNFVSLPASVKCDVTSYTGNQCRGNDDPLTAIMEKPKSGWTCAVSRDLIHWLGGQVYIEGIGIRKVNDLTDKNCKQPTIDIYVASVKEANKFGRQEKQVVFLGR